MDTPRNSLHVEESEKLGRTLRSDPPDRLGESTWGILENVIRDGKQTEALAILDYLQEGEVAPRHFFFADWVYGNFSYVVEVFGEDAYEDMFRATWGAKAEGKPGSVEGFEPGLLTDVRALVKQTCGDHAWSLPAAGRHPDLGRRRSLRDEASSLQLGRADAPERHDAGRLEPPGDTDGPSVVLGQSWETPLLLSLRAQSGHHGVGGEGVSDPSP